MITRTNFGEHLRKARGARGLRDVAAEIKVSHGTLSRVERGLFPDLDSFVKICEWMKVDPSEVLGFKKSDPEKPIERATVHFRKEKAISEDVAKNLAQMILAAQRAIRLIDENGDEI